MCFRTGHSGFCTLLLLVVLLSLSACTLFIETETEEESESIDNSPADLESEQADEEHSSISVITDSGEDFQTELQSNFDIVEIADNLSSATSLNMQGITAWNVRDLDSLTSDELEIIQEFLYSMELIEVLAGRNGDGETWGKDNVLFVDYFNMSIRFDTVRVGIIANNSHHILVSFKDGDGDVYYQMYEGSLELFKELVSMTSSMQTEDQQSTP